MAGVWEAQRSSSGVSQLTGPELKGGCLDAGSHKAEWQKKKVNIRFEPGKRG